MGSDQWADGLDGDLVVIAVVMPVIVVVVMPVVMSVVVSRGPCGQDLHAVVDRPRGEKLFGDNDPLKSREPTTVVRVGVAR